MVARFQQRRDDVRIGRHRAGPDPVQNRFNAVRELGDHLQADHPRSTLETVRRPKGLVQMRTVPLAPLQIHQPLFEADQELPRFFIEHLAETVV
jgi:hypothetical protein